uniref:Uncharacterized protein n=1 Tax=Cacopsylla melanoneura TaxID=428564 RepID=A0A8D9B9B8_9HEMI
MTRIQVLQLEPTFNVFNLYFLSSLTVDLSHPHIVVSSLALENSIDNIQALVKQLFNVFQRCVVFGQESIECIHCCHFCQLFLVDGFQLLNGSVHEFNIVDVSDSPIELH